MARKKKRKLAFTPDAQQGSDSGNHVSWFGTTDRLTDPSSHKVGETSNDPLTGRNLLTGAQEVRREGAASGGEVSHRLTPAEARAKALAYKDSSGPVTPAQAFADAILHGDPAQIKATRNELPPAGTLAAVKTGFEIKSIFTAMPQDQRDTVIKNVDANAGILGGADGFAVQSFHAWIQSVPPATRQHSTDPVALTGQDALRSMKESGLVNAGGPSIKGVTPALQAVVSRAMEIAPGKFGMYPTGGARSESEQTALKRAGWSKIGGNAGAHVQERAVDLIPIVDGKAAPDDKAGYGQIRAAMEQASKELGVPLTYGADWKSFPDLPHYEVSQQAAASFKGDPKATYSVPPTLEFNPAQKAELTKAGYPVGGAGSSGSWWTADRQSHAVDYMMKNAGLSEMGAKGLVSRWANVESKVDGPNAINPRSKAEGIGQWLGDRKGGYTLGDFDSQLAYAAKELNGGENAAGDALRAAKTPEQAAVGASMFERAEGYNPRTGRDNFVAQTIAGIPGAATQIAGAGGQDVAVGGDRSGGAAALAAGIGNHGLRKGSGNVGATLALQSALNDLGATDRFGHALKVDGRFGPRTYEAVKNYQADAGITQDGIVGPQTFKHISGDMADASFGVHVGTEGSPELAGQVPYSDSAPRFFAGPGPGEGPTARDYAAGMAVAAVTVDPVVSRAVRIPTGLDSGPVPADHPLRDQIEHVQNVSHWLDQPSVVAPSQPSQPSSSFSSVSDPYRPTGGSNGSFTGAVSGGSSSSGSFDSFAAGMSHTYQTVQSGGSVTPQPSYSVGGAGVYTPPAASLVTTIPTVSGFPG